MSGGAAPLVTIPLRNGEELRIAPDGVRAGERVFDLRSIQDARQVVPDPETIAFRIGGVGLVEFQPARSGDGAIALEAVYRLRPDLRPAGFESPATFPATGPAVPPSSPAPVAPPPGWGAPAYPAGQPYPPYPAYPPYMPPPGAYPPPGGYPPGMYPPPSPGYPVVPPPNTGYTPFGTTLDRSRGRLTPYPRGIGDMLGAIIQLFASHWKQWVAIALIVSFLPGLVVAGLEAGILAAFGQNPFASQSSLTSSIVNSLGISTTGTTTQLPSLSISPATAAFLAASGGAILVISLLASAWATGSLAFGVREAILDRPVRIGTCLTHGLLRLFPVLAVNILIGLLLVLCFVPVAVLWIFGWVALRRVDLGAASSQASSAAALFLLLAFLLFIPTFVLVIFLSVKLSLAPYLVATDRAGVFGALGQSWSLTRANWWRVFVVTLVVSLFLGVISYPASLVSVISVAIGLVVTALVGAFKAAVQAVTYISLLYDLRLRRDGFDAVLRTESPAAPSSAAQGPAQMGPSSHL